MVPSINKLKFWTSLRGECGISVWHHDYLNHLKTEQNCFNIVEYAPCTSPIMHFICPPTFITFVFHFSWVYTGKNNGFPFLDILGYLKNTHKNPNQGTWLGIPWLGLVSLCQIWDFCGYSLNTLKYPNMGINVLQPSQEKLKTMLMQNFGGK